MRTRWTQFLVVLTLLSLGTGFSRALHHAVAHDAGGAPVATCAGSCSSADHAGPAESEREHPADHGDEHCAVCATLAVTKSLVPSLTCCGPAAAPLVACLAPADHVAPAIEPLRVLRGRAPPIV